MKNSFKFFSNKDCKYYPCHSVEGDMNCMFCYCPLYFSGELCGGDFKYTKGGVKDCSACLMIHDENAWNFVNAKLKELHIKKETEDRENEK